MNKKVIIYKRFENVKKITQYIFYKIILKKKNLNFKEIKVNWMFYVEIPEIIQLYFKILMLKI